jgi:hypothetical protein
MIRDPRQPRSTDVANVRVGRWDGVTSSSDSIPKSQAMSQTESDCETSNPPVAPDPSTVQASLPLKFAQLWTVHTVSSMQKRHNRAFAMVPFPPQSIRRMQVIAARKALPAETA